MCRAERGMCATRSAQDDCWTWNCWFYARFVARVRPWVVSLLHFCSGGEKFRGLPFTHRWLTLVEGDTRQKTNRAKSPQIMYCHRGRVRSSFRISPIRYTMVIFIQNGLFCYFVLRPTRQCVRLRKLWLTRAAREGLTGQTTRDGKRRRMHVSPNSNESGSCVKEKPSKKEKLGDLDESVRL